MTPAADRRVLATLVMLVLLGAVRIGHVVDCDDFAVTEDSDCNKEDQ